MNPICILMMRLHLCGLKLLMKNFHQNNWGLMHLLVVKELTLITTLWPLECVSFCLILKTVYKHDNFVLYQKYSWPKKKQRCKYQHSDMAEDHMELVFLWQDMMWVVSKNKDLNLEPLPWVILALFPLSYAASCWNWLMHYFKNKCKWFFKVSKREKIRPYTFIPFLIVWKPWNRMH